MNKYILSVVLLILGMSNAHAQMITPDSATAYWGNELKVLKNLVEKGEHPNPVIQARYLVLKATIKERYGKDAYVGVILNAPSELVVASSIVEDDGPTIALFVPTIMRFEASLRKLDPKDWRECFEISMSVHLIHEMDHLASGIVSTPQDRDFSPETVLRREKQAWALTCEHTIDPMISAGSPYLSHDMRLRHLDWLKNKNAK